jgi:proteasome lid subunit RPN8/RPN11
MQLPTRRESAPMSPVFPEAWTHDVAEAAYNHAASVYPQEAAGIVEGGTYVPLANRSTTPGEDVRLSDDELIRVAQAEVFFHSHPDALGVPSEHDMIYQRQLGIPFVVMCLPTYDCFAWGDTLQRAPLIGRGFRHGVHDCYSLVRDWYAEAGVQLPEWPRGWEWWSEVGGKKNFYKDNFEALGFVEIPVGEATQKGDGLLFAFNFTTPMHAGVIIDRDLMIHHASGAKAVDSTRLSTLVPRTRYSRHAMMGLRRRS